MNPTHESGAPDGVSPPMMMLLAKSEQRCRFASSIKSCRLPVIPARLLSPGPCPGGDRRGDAALGRQDYLALLVANVGAVIEAQQRVPLGHATGCDRDAIIIGSVLVAVTATVGQAAPGTSFESPDAIAGDMATVVGQEAARWLFGPGTAGSSLLAALVVSPAARGHERGCSPGATA